MKIWKIRSLLYKTARFLGDVQAVRTGRIGQRIVRRIEGRLLARIFWRLFR